jgi:phosphatidate cytidylyltransferase
MKRAVTAFFLVPIAVYSGLFAPQWIFLAIVTIVALLCFREYAAITDSFAPRSFTFLGYAAGILILFAPERAVVSLIVLAALAAMCIVLSTEDLGKGFGQAAALVLGIIYIFGAWKTAILLHDFALERAAFRAPAGRHWLMFGLMVNWIGDTGAYYIGRKFGKHKLAPTVSPGKSWEGAAASVMTAVIFGLIYLPLTIRGTSLVVAGLFALVANAAGQVGDLAESAIKRGAGVKDSGSLLPGHGGFLDRVDSTLFALPVLYSMLAIWKG